jgi:hypothetical protein
VSGQERPEAHAQHLPGDDDGRQEEHGFPVRHEDRGVDQRADRDEEHGREHVADRLDKALDELPVPRLRDQGSGQEGSQAGRVPGALGEERHHERQADAGDDERLAPPQAEDPSHRARHDEQPARDHRAQEDEQADGRLADDGGLHHLADRQRGEHGEEQEADEVLVHERADDDGSERPAHALVLERLLDDRGARDRQARAREHALALAPAEEPAGAEPEPHEEPHLDERDERRGHPQLADAAQVELEPEREQDQDHAETRDRVERVLVHDQRGREVRADDHAGDEVPEDHRLPQPLAHDGRRGGHAEDHGEIAHEDLGGACRLR